MKRFCKGCVMALSMFTVIPMPAVWDDAAFRWVMPAFPLVGGVIGALWYGAARALEWLGPPIILQAALLLLAPLFLSGFIHMDGYMDTCDAVFSRADLDKKRMILKDPHVGAFAAAALGVYLLLGCASLCGALERGAEQLVLVFIPVLSRCVAGVALLTARPMSAGGFGASFRQGASAVHKAAVLCFAAAALAAGCVFGGHTAARVLGALLVSGTLAAVYAVRQLKGVSGDVCGFIITACELCALLVWAIA